MDNMSPVETLREIRANFAALQAERDILSDELNSERECSTALGAYLDQAHKDVEQISDELSAARARIAELEAARRWVPVGERLPKEDLTVLAWGTRGNGKNYHTWPAWYRGGQWFDDNLDNDLRITHWQPLPAAPEVEK